MVIAAFLAPVVCAACAAPPTKSAATDVVEIQVETTKPVFAGDEQPTFTVKFHNKGSEYINLYNGDAYWSWRIVFRGAARAHRPGPWQMSFDKPAYLPTSMPQMKVGETHDVKVDLNDPACTFEYLYAGPMDHLVAPIRHLRPGHYRMELTISLNNPFGSDTHEWTGPGVANPIEFDVLRASERKPTAEELATWNAAIDSVAKIVSEPYGLWQNGSWPILKLSRQATPEDVLAASLDGTDLGSKAYKILHVRDIGGGKSAAFVTVGKKSYVMLYFFSGSWQSRFYPA